MALDTIADALAITNDITALKNSNGQASNSYINNIAAILDAGFQRAVPTKPNVDISPPAGTLLIPFQIGTNNMMPEIIGKACADYWKLAIKEIIVASVINDAGKIAAPIALNIRALFNRGFLYPSYFDFVNAIHTEVLTIKWTAFATTVPNGPSFIIKVV